MPRMDPSLVPLHYAHEVTLFRRRKDKSCRAISTVNGGRLMTTFDGERLDAAAVVWCLHYGNWPKFPLAIVDGDPHNLSLDNIYPIRLGAVRYRETMRKFMYHHPLSDLPFRSSKECFSSWVALAREHYQKDLNYVLALEARDRDLVAQAPTKSRGLIDWENRQEARRATLAHNLARNVAAAEGKTLPKRPPKVAGMVWHYWQKSWVSVPVPVHVSDDCRRRCCAFSRGAVRAEYQPIYDATWYFDAAGEVVMPLPHTKATKSVSAKA